MKFHTSVFMLVVIFMCGCATHQPIKIETMAIGDWNIIANSNPGKLEIRETNGKLTGRVWFEKTNRWENLTKVRINGDTLKFDRGHQKFTAVYHSEKLTGTFFTLGRNYDWVGTR